MPTSPPHQPASPASPWRTRLIVAALIAVAAAALVAVAPRSTPSAPGTSGALPAATWHAALADARSGADARLVAALEPIDAYFDEVALAGVPAFLAEFSGPVDSATFIWQSALDGLGRVRGTDTARVERRTRDALRAHIGLPDGLGRAIAASAERFAILQAQVDSALLPQLVFAAGGPGIDTPGRSAAWAEHTLAAARTRARQAALEAALTSRGETFAWQSAGRESLVLLLQTRIAWSIGARVAGALGVRTTLAACGAGAAGASACAGPPGWAAAAGELAAVIAADLTLSWLLERHAAGELRSALNELRANARAEVAAHLRHVEAETMRLRAAALAAPSRPLTLPDLGA